MEQVLIDIILSVGNVISQDGTTIIVPFNEVIVDTAEKCLEAAKEINLQAVGQGIMAFCYPVPETVLVQ